MIQFRKYHHPVCNCLTFKGTLLEKFSHTPKLPSNYLCQLQHPSSEGFVLDRLILPQLTAHLPLPMVRSIVRFVLDRKFFHSRLHTSTCHIIVSSLSALALLIPIIMRMCYQRAWLRTNRNIINSKNNSSSSIGYTTADIEQRQR